MALFDAFLKVDGIEGESQDSKHKGEIDVLSFTWGATQTGTAVSGGGLGAGKVAMQDLHITKQVDKASPKLMLACASGDHIKSAVLTARKAGKDQQEFLKITLSDVLVSSYQAGGTPSGSSVPTEQVSFNFAKIEKEYKEQKSDGTLGGTTKSGWDVKANKKV
jgi:type VI secretion system secreted protein Hcp